MVFPLSGWSEDAAVTFFFVFVALSVFTGMAGSYSNSPFVWGFALFFGVVGAAISALTGAGLGILLPVLLIGMILYFQVLGKVLGDGVVAWIMCAFVIMMLAAGGY